MRHGPHGRRDCCASTSGSRAWRRCSTTSRSTSARAPDASPAVLCGIAPHADAGRHLVSDRRHACGARRRWSNWRVSSAWKSAPARGVAAHPRERRAGDGRASRDSGETVAAARRCFQLRTRSARTANSCDETAGTASAFEKRRKYEPACSGVVLYLGLAKSATISSLHHNFVFSRDPHEEFEAIYRQGEPAPDPTCYVCAPARHRARCRAARRRSALRPRPHAVPAARITTGRAMLPATARRSSTS